MTITDAQQLKTDPLVIEQSPRWVRARLERPTTQWSGGLRSNVRGGGSKGRTVPNKTRRKPSLEGGEPVGDKSSYALSLVLLEEVSGILYHR